MKTLNLVDLDKSDIKYKKITFPDGQQNVVLQDISNHIWIHNNVRTSIEIKSRLNNWLDLELITCAVASLRELGAEEIHLYTPYIVGARSDRKFEEGGNNYLKDVICPIINSLNFKTVTCIDPHSDVLEACIKGFRKESNKWLFDWLDVEHKSGRNTFHPFNGIWVSPDAGASKKIYKLAEQSGYKGDIITCSKDRDENGKLTKCVVPIKDTGPLCKKDYLIIDDICDGGATFINIAKELKKAYNCNKIYLIITHGIFSKGFKELNKYFDDIYCTNSYKDLEVNNTFIDKNNNIKEFVKQLNVF